MLQAADVDTDPPRPVLRIALVILTSVQMLFVITLSVFISAHANPRGDGMEFVAVGAAIMLLELPFTVPAFILAVWGRALGVAAGLAGFATFAYFIFWIQVYTELTARTAL